MTQHHMGDGRFDQSSHLPSHGLWVLYLRFHVETYFINLILYFYLLKCNLKYLFSSSDCYCVSSSFLWKKIVESLQHNWKQLWLKGVQESGKSTHLWSQQMVTRSILFTLKLNRLLRGPSNSIESDRPVESSDVESSQIHCICMVHLKIEKVGQQMLIKKIDLMAA